MSDIVERLRTPQRGWRPEHIAAGQVCVDAVLLEEAARVIEELRAQIDLRLSSEEFDRQAHAFNLKYGRTLKP